MTTYTNCEGEIYGRARALIEAYHPLLKAADVTIALLFAHAPRDEETGEPTGPALKFGGYPAAGVTRIVNLKDRVKGCADAEIVLDGDQWEEWTTEQQDALIDHELQHIDVRQDSERVEVCFLYDPIGRPLLRLRKHDHQFGWFDVIAKRHGAASFEVQQAAQVYVSCGQLYFAFAGPQASNAHDVLREARSPKRSTRGASDKQIGGAA